MAQDLPPVPDDPVRPPPVSIAGEVALRFPSRGAELDGRLSLPEGARDIVVVCHPHPLYGGTMHNVVVVAITKALLGRGAAVLRFDFRGVGASSGRFDDGDAEVEDVAAALAEASRRLPAARALLAGYSFGAACALRLALGMAATSHPRPERLVLVAPVPRASSLDPANLDDARVAAMPPVLAIAADRDQFADVAEVRALADRLGAELEIVPGDHFFMGARRRAADLATGFLLGPASPR